MSAPATPPTQLPTQEPGPPFATGELVAGKYRVERVIGEGGMAVVVAARHEELNQLVAIKILRPDLAQQEIAALRFVREARAAARIQSDHVARVFDVGTTDAGQAYMVLEHLEGIDLEELLVKQGPLPIDEAVDCILEALEGVAHAHTLGVVHRDLKPANLFLVNRPDGSRQIKILDFGLSKSDGWSAPAAARMVTAANALLGSPAYMAPEQARSSASVDLRADIWSLGVILYELLAGSPPFEGDSPLMVLASIATDPPIPLRPKRPDVPPELEAVVLRCLERERDKRFSNAAELAHAIAPWGSARTDGLVARISLVLGVPTPSDPPGVAARTSMQPGAAGGARVSPMQGARSSGVGEGPATAKSYRLWGLIGIAALLGLGMIAASAWRATRTWSNGPSAGVAPQASAKSTANAAAPPPSAAPEPSSSTAPFAASVPASASASAPASASASAPASAPAPLSPPSPSASTRPQPPAPKVKPRPKSSVLDTRD